MTSELGAPSAYPTWSFFSKALLLEQTRAIGDAVLRLDVPEDAAQIADHHRRAAGC